MIAKYILFGLMILGLGINIAEHGRDRKPTNAWTSLISLIITTILLYYSGFFENM